jgi:uncharacterized protein YkwD
MPRPKSIACSLVLCAAIALLAAAEPADAARSRLDATEKRVIRHVNRIRARYRLPAFLPSRPLARSADFHSKDMLRGNFFAHASSNGTSFGARVRRYTRATRIGENLAWVAGGRRPGVVRQVVGMWMASPPHRAALLAADFRKVGVARRTGYIGRQRVTVFTADLATRR